MKKRIKLKEMLEQMKAKSDEKRMKSEEDERKRATEKHTYMFLCELNKKVIKMEDSKKKSI